MLRTAQRVGLSIQDIRQAFEALTPGEAPNREDWERFAVRLRRAATDRIDELFKALDELTPTDSTTGDGTAVVESTAADVAR